MNTIYKFNVETESITELSTILAESTSGISTSKIGSDVYTFGGNTHWRYIFNTDDETVDHFDDYYDNPSRSLRYMGVVTVGSNVYLFGGSLSSASKLDTIYKFNVNF